MATNFTSFLSGIRRIVTDSISSLQTTINDYIVDTLVNLIPVQFESSAQSFREEQRLERIEAERRQQQRLEIESVSRHNLVQRELQRKRDAEVERYTREQKNIAVRHHELAAIANNRRVKQALEKKRKEQRKKEIRQEKERELEMRIITSRLLELHKRERQRLIDAKRKLRKIVVGSEVPPEEELGPWGIEPENTINNYNVILEQKNEFVRQIIAMAELPTNSYPEVSRNFYGITEVYHEITAYLPNMLVITGIQDIESSVLNLPSVANLLYSVFSTPAGRKRLERLTVLIGYTGWSQGPFGNFESRTGLTVTFTLEGYYELLNKFMESSDWYKPDYASDVYVTFREKRAPRIPSGAFLPYYLPASKDGTLPIELLERYQISYQTKDYEVHTSTKLCLQHCINLINYEQNPSGCENSKYQPIRIPLEYCVSDRVPISYLHKLACMLKITFCLRIMRRGLNTSQPRYYPKYYDPSYPVYNIALLKDHYFVYDKLVPTPYLMEKKYPASNYLPPSSEERKRFTSVEWMKILIECALEPMPYEIISKVRSKFNVDVPVVNNKEISKYTRKDLEWVRYDDAERTMFECGLEKIYCIDTKTKKEIDLVSSDENQDKDADEDVPCNNVNKDEQMLLMSITQNKMDRPFALTRGVPSYSIIADIESMPDDKHIPICLKLTVIAPYRKGIDEIPTDHYEPRVYVPGDTLQARENLPYVLPRVSHQIFVGLDCIKQMINYLRTMPPIYYVKAYDAFDHKRADISLCKPGADEPGDLFDPTIPENVGCGRWILLHFHNLRYDIDFIKNHTGITRWLGSVGTCKGAAAVLPGKIPTNIIFKDTKAFLNVPLAELPSMFGFNNDRELGHKMTFPYTFFTSKNNFDPSSPRSATCSLEDLLKHIPGYPIDKLIEDVKLAKALKANDRVLYWEYLAYYCAIDVGILVRAYEKFRTDVLKLKLDINRISSLHANFVENANLTLNEKGVMELAFNTYRQKVMNHELDISIMDSAFNKITRDDIDSIYQQYRSELLEYNLGEITPIDVYDVYTISSLSMIAFQKKGVFTGVNAITGPVRDFISESIRGGRTMTRDNFAYHLMIECAYYDCTSLYSSAMKRLSGYLKGDPKTIPNEWLTEPELTNLLSVDGFFVEIKIICDQVPNPLPFPLLSIKDKDGKLVYANKCRGIIVVVARFAMEALLKYHSLRPHIDFELIRGYYYNEGRQNVLAEAVDFFFALRKEYKRNKNTLEATIKLILNSAYGKTIQGDFSTSHIIKFFDSIEKFHTFQDKQDYFIRSFSVINSQLIYKKENDMIVPAHQRTVHIEMDRPDRSHFNYAHCGAEVLDMSKLIMYEVFDCADKVGGCIYYTDTDSIIIEKAKLKETEQEFVHRYNRPFLGKELSQFHPDFEPGNNVPTYYTMLHGDESDVDDPYTPYSVESIILGRKMVCHRVRYQARLDYIATNTKENWRKLRKVMKDFNDKTNLEYCDGRFIGGETTLYYYHTRMKGVSKAAIEHGAKEKGSDMSLFKSMFYESPWEADMTGGGKKPVFRYDMITGVGSITEFNRNIACNLERHLITSYNDINLSFPYYPHHSMIKIANYIYGDKLTPELEANFSKYRHDLFAYLTTITQAGYITFQEKSDIQAIIHYADLEQLQLINRKHLRTRELTIEQLRQMVPVRIGVPPLRQKDHSKTRKSVERYFLRSIEKLVASGVMTVEASVILTSNMNNMSTEQIQSDVCFQADTIHTFLNPGEKIIDVRPNGMLIIE